MSLGYYIAMRQPRNKLRVFAHIYPCDTDRICLFLAVSEDEKHFFRREVEIADCRETLLSEKKDFPAARAFAEFERFCVDECGLTDGNDEVIFTNNPHRVDVLDTFDYIAWQLGGVPWAVVKFIHSQYDHETTHLDSPLSFEQFVRSCDIGLDEPVATKHLYDEYRRLIHKDSYSPQELDRMETYIFGHIDEAYLSYRQNFGVVCSIAHICAATYHSDKARFLRLIEWIVTDFNKRQRKWRRSALSDIRKCKRQRSTLADILMIAAEEVADDGYIDCDVVAAEENKPPLERSEYGIFRAVAPKQLKTIKNILEEFD